MRNRELKHDELREGMRVEKFDPLSGGWIPGTIQITTYQGVAAPMFIADGGQFAPSPTWPDSRFMEINTRDEDEESAAMEEEEAYLTTSEDEALQASLLSGIVINKIQHLYAAGKYTLETYNELYEVTRNADRQVKTLLKMLMPSEKKPVVSISETEVNEAVAALLQRLPAGYPQGSFTKETNGYQLMINYTMIFQGASGEDAIRDTQHYVDARKKNPDLPVGVIYGIYD